MSNALTTQTNDSQALAAVAFAGGFNPFTSSAKAEGVTEGVYGRFNGNSGSYIVGDGELAPGTPVVMAFLDAKVGWLGFDLQNKPHRGPEETIISGKALADPPQTPGVKWQKQITLPIVTMEGQQIMYAAKADKPTRPMWRLVKQFGELVQRHRGSDGKYMMPVVTLNSASFQMQVDEPMRDPANPNRFIIDPATGQPKMEKMTVTKFREDFKIVDWMEQTDIEALVAGAVPEEDAPAEPQMKTVGGTVIDAKAEVIPPSPPAQPAASGFRKPVRAGQQA
jgi:hypothetical protein